MKERYAELNGMRWICDELIHCAHCESRVSSVKIVDLR